MNLEQGANMRSAQEPSGLVLIVEDNRNISEMVGEYLEGRGFEVDFAADGLDGYRLAAENSYDVIVLDLMLPRLDGIEVCKRLREEARKSTPVLMLTARDTLDEKLTGLSAGADDYLTKPFDMDVLKARVRALLRRGGARRSDRLAFGGIMLDRLTRQAVTEGKKLQLTPKEYSLLEYLIVNAERVVTRTELLEKVWDVHFDPGSNVVDVHVARLRDKLRRMGSTAQLVTVRGTGFMLTLNNHQANQAG